MVIFENLTGTAFQQNIFYPPGMCIHAVRSCSAEVLPGIGNSCCTQRVLVYDRH